MGRGEVRHFRSVVCAKDIFEFLVRTVKPYGLDDASVVFDVIADDVFTPLRRAQLHHA